MGRAVSRIAGEVSRHEARLAHRNSGNPEVIATMISRAGGIAAAEAAKLVGEQHSIAGIAAMLGVEVKEAYLLEERRIPHYLKTPVPAADRVKFGYGELPNVLINGVTRVVLRLGSDQMSPEPIKKLSAHVMATMWDYKEKKYSDGIMSGDSLHEQLAERLVEAPIMGPGTVVEPDVLATYGAAIDLSYFLTAQYINRQSSFTQTVTDMTEAV